MVSQKRNFTAGREKSALKQTDNNRRVFAGQIVLNEFTHPCGLPGIVCSNDECYARYAVGIQYRGQLIHTSANRRRFLAIKINNRLFRATKWQNVDTGEVYLIIEYGPGVSKKISGSAKRR